MQEILESILNEVNSDSYIGMYDVGGPYPSRGQFLIRGLPFGAPMQRIGYVTQIRIGKGQFKSDMYFLRLADGSLITCENDCYLKLTEDQEAKVRTVFSTLPEDEGFDDDPIYKDCSGQPEKGFIITNSDTKPSPDSSFSILIQTKSD